MDTLLIFGIVLASISGIFCIILGIASLIIRDYVKNVDLVKYLNKVTVLMFLFFLGGIGLILFSFYLPE